MQVDIQQCNRGFTRLGMSGVEAVPFPICGLILLTLGCYSFNINSFSHYVFVDLFTLVKDCERRTFAEDTSNIFRVHSKIDAEPKSFESSAFSHSASNRFDEIRSKIMGCRTALISKRNLDNTVSRYMSSLAVSIV
ncbi:hypothetical protein CEXT_692781 [Caerostris extrusa]|uniref:Uncharacterized protein n=1 Tax=Caerostris extrusa TaxID=172846 RepID=A0AAV4M8J6_CAEEX|nr:hypothetical protein CEXT_692781 [Caerostris extrusa]